MGTMRGWAAAAQSSRAEPRIALTTGRASFLKGKFAASRSSSRSRRTFRLLGGSIAMNVLRAARTAAVRQRTHAAPRRLKHYLNADRATFDKLTSATHTADRVVLVDFYAEWCNPCKILSPILEKLAADESVKSGTGRAVDLITVDTDAEVGLAAQFDVRTFSLPSPLPILARSCVHVFVPHR
ncbi:hypothetical protein EVG20_g11411 [Dentipellis fragilis]|uniref:Thioredoxin domain-containing protein n=1 Tax=Dentipellis fragilis TaxID=205917 RepID=A0A4Y9XMQ3_9AGAM|nr:hypothetical protein EVG20_g11411 [Dentipellis fragilis]